MSMANLFTQPKKVPKSMQPTITNIQINNALSFTQMFTLAWLQIAACSKNYPQDDVQHKEHATFVSDHQ
jgi:hypothetical protein